MDIFTGKVDPTQLTNMLWKFWFMQDTFVFYQLLGNDQSAVELRITEPPVSLLQLNLECDPPLFLGYPRTFNNFRCHNPNFFQRFLK